MHSPIHIGILHSQEGPMAPNELLLIKAALLAVDEINEKGGLLGRRVKAHIPEWLSDAESFEKAASSLLRQIKPCALFGCWTSSSRKAVKRVVEQQNSLLWYPVQYEGLEQSPNVVYTGSCMNQQIAPAVEWALSTGKRRFALVGSDYVFPRTANKLVTSMLATTDAHVVYEKYKPLDCKDFSSLITDLRESRPDIIINTVNGIGNIYFFEQMYRAGMQEQGITLSMSCTEDLYSKYSYSPKGHLACWGYFQSLDNPDNRSFLRKLASAGIFVSSDPIATAYSQVLLWASVVERIGSFDHVDVRNNLAGSGINCPLGRLEIRPNQHVLRNGLIGRCDEHGQFDVLWQSDGPIEPLPWLGIEQTDLPFKGLLLQVLNQLPQDITMRAQLETEVLARKAMATALEKTIRRLSESEEIAKIGGFERNLESGEGYWSDTLFHILGESPGKLRPSLREFTRHLLEEDRQDFVRAISKSVRSATELNCRCRIRRADGKIRHVQVRNVVLFDEHGCASHYHGTVMDITDQVLIEDALKANEERMRLLAQTDALTGLLNRRRFLELVTKEIERSDRYALPFTLIMFDVDKFKLVNDTYGHDVGDKVLKSISERAKEVAREVDIVGRLGGEEFAIALPQTGMDGAITVAERLRATVEDHVITIQNHALHCTISLGVATMAGCINNADGLLKAADLAVYRAKKEGRNRVERMIPDDFASACALTESNH